MLREAQEECLKGHELESAMIPGVVHALLEEAQDLNAKVDFLRALHLKGETENELAHFAKALLPKAVACPIRGSFEGVPLFDCCGTGGGGLNIVNLSTALMPVLAACGVPVVKHGNRGVTKKSGSADVLESLGVSIDLKPDQIASSLETCGMAFLMAPHFHPAFKNVAPARKVLALEGQRTIFNLLGPLLNPCRPKTQLLGVFQAAHVNLFQKSLHTLERDRFIVVCGYDADGLPIGEVSPTGTNLARGFLKEPFEGDFSMRLVEGSLKDLAVSSKEESATRIMAFLNREEKGLLRHTIFTNAAVALQVHGTVEVLSEGYMLAAEAVDSGNALQRLKMYQQISHEMKS